MQGLFATLLMSALVLYLVSLGLVVKARYENVVRLSQIRAEKEEFVLANATGRDVQELVSADVDVKRDNCMQAVVQICSTLAAECKTTNALDVWGWAIAAVAGDPDLIESDVDYKVVSSQDEIDPSDVSYVDLASIPEVTTYPGGNCTRDVLIERGRYYYTQVRNVLGCDEFLLDLNQVAVSGGNPCAYFDVLKRKQ